MWAELAAAEGWRENPLSVFLLASGSRRHSLACRWPSSPRVFPLCDVSLHPNFMFLLGHPSYWIMARLNDLIFKLISVKTLFPNKVAF